MAASLSIRTLSDGFAQLSRSSVPHMRRSKKSGFTHSFPEISKQYLKLKHGRLLRRPFPFS